MFRIFRHSTTLVAVSLGLVCLATGSAQGEVIYKESLRSFELGPQLYTRDDIWQAIRRNGSTRHGSSTTTVGWANTRIRYNVEYSHNGSSCSVSNIRIHVDAKLYLPQWSYLHQAELDLRQYYACIKDTVTTHEQRHGQIARETGERLERAFWQELNGIPCSSTKELTRRIFDRVYAGGRQRQADFDRRDYALNRYQSCNRQNPFVAASRFGGTAIDRTRGSRVTRTGRKWQERATQSAELTSRDAPRGGLLPNVNQPETQRVPQTRSANSSANAQQTELTLAAMRLVVLLIVIGTVVFWLFSRRRRAIAAQAGTIAKPDHSPNWMESAIEAAKHAKATQARATANAGPDDNAQTKRRTRTANSQGFGRRGVKT